MSALDPDHVADLREHSIATWPRVYVAATFAVGVTFLSTLLLGTAPVWNAVTGVGILFSIATMFYALLAVGLTTYFETSARHDYDNSLFTRSTLPLEVFIMKEALKPPAK